MIRLKTAVLIGASFRMGGLVAEVSEEDQQQLFDFGIHTGLLFQLRDDLLDTYGNAELFGKKQYGDIVNNKKTFLYLKALELTSGKDRKKLAELYSNPASDPEAKIRKVLKYFDEVNVKKHTEDQIQKNYLIAQQAFNTLKVEEKKKEPLRNYTEQLMGRSY
jgi:geranylgeranyl diphosphate synthase type II